MHFYIFLFTFLFSSFTAQSQGINDLIELENKETDLEKKVSLMIDIAWEYMLIENDSSLTYANKALELSQEKNYPYGEILALEMQGIYQEAVSNQFGVAISNYLKAIETAKENNIDYLASLYLSIGILFERTDNPHRAEEYYKNAIEEGQKSNELGTVKIASINLAGIYNEIGKYKEGIQLIEESLKYPIIDDENDAAYHIMGGILMNLNKNEEAQNHLLKSIQSPIANKDLRYKYHYARLIDNKLILKDYSGLDSLLKITEDFYFKTESINEKSGLIASLSNAYYHLKDYEKALYYKDLQLNIQDSVNKLTREDLIYDLEIKYQTDITKGELEKKKIEQRIYLAVAISGLLLAFLLGFFFYKNKKKNALLAKQKAMLEVTIDEKNTLLKETHHRVKNSFQIVSSLLYLQSENISDQEAQLAIKEAQNRVRSMVLIHQKLYNKDQLVGINTKEYFNDLTKDIMESHQDKSQEITYHLDVDSLVLSIESITPIGLILNELITNVLKHAFTSVKEIGKELHISLKEIDNKLELEVSDNGEGITKQPSDSSFGIKLIKALSKKLKASLTYKENKPKGTIAKVSMSRYEVL